MDKEPDQLKRDFIKKLVIGAFVFIIISVIFFAYEIPRDTPLEIIVTIFIVTFIGLGLGVWSGYKKKYRK